MLNPHQGCQSPPALYIPFLNPNFKTSLATGILASTQRISAVHRHFTPTQWVYFWFWYQLVGSHTLPETNWQCQPLISHRPFFFELLQGSCEDTYLFMSISTMTFHPPFWWELPPKVHKEALQDVVFRSFQGQLCEAILCWSCRQVSSRQDARGNGKRQGGRRMADLNKC